MRDLPPVAAPPLPRVDGIVFDLDGTLADTLDDIGAAMNHVLGSFGLPTHARDEYRTFVGEGAAVLVRKALPAGRADLADAVLVAFRARYGAHLLDSTRPYDGIAEALAALGRAGVSMAVLSNKPHAMTEHIVHELFGRGRFRAVAGERAGIPKKPDPTALLEIVHALGARPDRCAVVGDGETDMKAAVAAGLVPIGVAWGFRPPAALVRTGALAVLDSPRQIAELARGRR